MIKNYFFLIRQCSELETALHDATVGVGFTQEKDILMLPFSIGGNNALTLELSCSQISAHILLRDGFHRAKKNTIDFFEYLSGEKLNSISIGRFERIIRFGFGSKYLYYQIRGNKSNVFVADADGSIDAFLKTDSHQTDFSDLVFNTADEAAEYAATYISNCTEEQFSEIGGILSKDIIEESKKRASLNALSMQVNAAAILNEVFYSPFCLAAFANPPRLSACPVSFQGAKENSLRESLQVNEIIKYKLIEQFRVDAYKRQFMQVQKYLEKEKNFILQKIGKMRPIITDDSREILYKKCGDVLLANLHDLHETTNTITLADYENDGKPLTIALDAKLTIAANAEVYYAKARNAAKQRAQFAKDLPSIERKLVTLEQQEELLRSVKDLKEIEKLAKEILQGSNNKDYKDNSPESKFRRFYIFDTYMVLVGKDAHNNDVLTVQYAKQNDFWFHARSVAGSHVVVRNEGNKESLDKTVLQAAASLAAYYSKAKAAKLVPVAYTQKKYVVKRKGMDPGQVGLLKEKVIMVKPEIPAICIPYGAKDAEE